MTTDLDERCRVCGHHRDAHWWQEPSQPDPILRCKDCENDHDTCLASYPGNPLPIVGGITLCTTLYGGPTRKPSHE